MSKIPTRDEAYSLLVQYNQNPSLIKHALAVEAVMRHFAKKYGEAEKKWGIVGLLHDLDYEKYPETHLEKQREILEKEGYPEEIIRATESHGWGICTEVKPETKLEKTLYAIDELTGLVVTSVLVRPSKSIMDLSVKSVKKKWKDKRFAAGVDRSVIEKGTEMLGMPLDDVISGTIEGMKSVAKELDLAGA